MGIAAYILSIICFLIAGWFIPELYRREFRARRGGAAVLIAFLITVGILLIILERLYGNNNL